MTDLPPYNPRTGCAKCGYDHSSTKYQVHPEHLLRMCLNCGYQWHEAVLPEDAPQDEDPLFRAGRAYRLKAPGYRDQRVIVIVSNDEYATGMWWDGDRWKRGQSDRPNWEELS